MERSCDIEKKHPIPTDKHVQSILRRKINAVRNHVESPIRLGNLIVGLISTRFNKDNSQPLFSFTAEKYSDLEEYIDWKDKRSRDYGKKWRVESDRLQALGIGVMKEYGFNEEIWRPEYSGHGWTEDGTMSNREEGTSEENRLYPSDAIEGLVFERSRIFDTATGKTLCVSWDVVDKASTIRINLGKKSRRRA